MSKTVESYIAKLIQAYQMTTKKTCSEMALDFDVTLSNLYRYRMGTGNPRARTIDKIILAIQENCPELLDQKSDDPGKEGYPNGPFGQDF